MPKRPPKVRQELPVAADLRGDGVHLAVDHPSGRLWRADCLQFLGEIRSGSVRLVVADPPYAIDKDEWDKFESLEAYVGWCDVWLKEIERILLPDGTAYVCGFSEILAEIKVRSARHFAGGCRWLVWSYRNKANLGKDWGRSHESILHLRKSRGGLMNVDDVRIPYNDHTKRYPNRVQAVSSQYSAGKRRDEWAPHPLGAKPRDVFDIPVLCNGMGEKTGHPTQKPEELIERFVRASSAPDDLVVDPFAGSGTSLLVAGRLGRKYLGADQDSRYVTLARARLQAAGLA